MKQLVKILRSLLPILLWLPVESASASASTLNLNQIFLSTIENNQELKAAQSTLEQARAWEKEAGRHLFPSVSLNANVTHQEYPGYQSLPAGLAPGVDLFPTRLYGASFDVDQPIYLGGRIWNAWRFREVQRQKAEWDQRATQQKVLAEILQLVWNWSAQSEILKVLGESKDRQEEFVRLTRRRLKTGNAREYELLQGEADLISYEPRMSEIKERLISLQKGIQVLSGIPKTSVFPASFFSQSDKSPKIEVRGEFLQRSREQNPELRAAELGIQLARLNREIDLGEHRPSVSIKGRWGWSSPDRGDIGSESAKSSSLTLQLSVPLFSGLTSLEVKRAGQSGIQAAEAAYQSALDRQLIRLEEGKAALVASGQRLGQSRQWRQKAEKALAEGIKSYRVGLTSNFQVVQLQAARERAALGEIQSRLDHHVKFLNWKLALGEPVEEWSKGLTTPHIKGP
ncbi:MAG: TolC family protein [Bdellovibrionaceae bacterium]|nr:TolC family protein [Bdellovibrionales bacterium]MCB9082915.1 TolC family protein [Pseudobdellovibrionaceae bacterium]